MNLEIPFPCSEDIDHMNPSGDGRYCGACDKVIIDFTALSLPEIQSYFLNHSNEKTCGIFKNETIIAQEYAIPLEIIQQNYNRWKNIFILAFMVAFGFLTFGCGEEKKEIPLATTGISTPLDLKFDTSYYLKSLFKNKGLEGPEFHTIGFPLPVLIPEIDSIETLTGDVEVVKIEDTSKMDTNNEFIIGKTKLPDSIQKPNLKGRIIGDTILNQPIIDSSKKCNQKNVVTIKAKKLSNRQPPIIDFPQFITGVPKLN